MRKRIMENLALENLALKRPRGNKIRAQNSSLSVVYELVRAHLSEIEEARMLGYTWKQIDSACREVWQEQSDQASGIVWWKSGLLIRFCYCTVKNGTRH